MIGQFSKMYSANAIVLSMFTISSIFATPPNEPNRGRKYEIILLNAIFNDYVKTSRPVANFNSPVEVNISISLHQILKVDERNQIFTANLWRSSFWKDDFLKWNPIYQGNITKISVPLNQIWAPDILLYNSASYDVQIENRAKVILRHDGLVTDVLPMITKTTCKIDVTWFPFDEQKCSLIFGSWSHSSEELRLELNRAIDTSLLIGLIPTSSGEWSLLSVKAKKVVHYDPYTPTELYPMIIFEIHLKRHAFYYFFNLLIPCGLIGFLAILGFTLPPESGEKLPLGATILFSLISFLNMISESMPASSDAVPLLGTYFNCIMFTIALSVVSTIVVNLKLKANNAKELQGLSKKIFFCSLPRILCMNSLPNVVAQLDNKRNSEDTIEIHLKRSGGVCSAVSLPSHPHRIAERQWIFVAAVVDRMCLIFSLLVTFVSVTVFLVYAF